MIGSGVAAEILLGFEEEEDIADDAKELMRKGEEGLVSFRSQKCLGDCSVLSIYLNM